MFVFLFDWTFAYASDRVVSAALVTSPPFSQSPSFLQDTFAFFSRQLSYLTSVLPVSLVIMGFWRGEAEIERQRARQKQREVGGQIGSECRRSLTYVPPGQMLASSDYSSTLSDNMRSKKNTQSAQHWIKVTGKNYTEWSIYIASLML